jgi:gliding motility-associated-like protein
MNKKRYSKIVLFLVFFGTSLYSHAQFITVQDTALAHFLCDSFPQVMSGDCKQLDTVQAKLVVSKIDGKARGISIVKEMRYFEQVPSIAFEDNLITELPDFSQLPNLTLLNFNGNKLSGIIDFSKYTILEFIILNRNAELTGITGLSQLTSIKSIQLINCNFTSVPDILSLSTLTKVYLYKNNLTFSDIIPLTNHANFATAFTVFPQNNTPATDTIIQKIEGEEITLNYVEDAAISGLTYTWYCNNEMIKTSAENFITIPSVTILNQGNYFVSIKSNNPLLALDSITSRLFTVQVSPKPCIQIGYYNLAQHSYCDSIILSISVPDADVSGYTFYVEKTFNNQQTVFTNGIDFKIEPGTYKFVLTNGSNCTVTFDTNKRFDFKDDCIKYFTPNADGDGDSWAIQDTGHVKIINSQGVTIKELDCPTEWDGTTNSNSLAPDGKYMIVFPDGKNSSISLFR